MYVPERIVTNHDLAKLMDTSDEWIVQRSGISERRHADEGMGPSDLAARACEQAIAAAQLKPSDIDLILVATLSPEHYFPGTSVFLQRKLGLETTPAMDIRCQCSGFLYGLQAAQAFITSSTYRRVLLCGVEVHSRGLDFSTRGRDVTVLFGDGAGAVVVELSTNPERGIQGIELHAQGEHAEKLWMPYPSMSQLPFITHENIERGEIWPQMEGRNVFKHAVTRMPEVLASLLGKLKIQPEEIDLFLFHQANLRINEAVMAHLNQPMTKAPNNIERYGNCSAASIPMLLDEQVRAGAIRPGSKICMTGFGSGFTWGSAVIIW
jgi:3-oxoacyl-[acyl-carrier-protein] synthase-3